MNAITFREHNHGYEKGRQPISAAVWDTFQHQAEHVRTSILDPQLTHDDCVMWTLS